MFRKDRMGRRVGGVLLYIKENIPAYEVHLQEEADGNEVIWCNLVTGHTTVTIGVVYRTNKDGRSRVNPRVFGLATKCGLHALTNIII